MTPMIQELWNTIALFAQITGVLLSATLGLLLFLGAALEAIKMIRERIQR